MEMDVVGTAEVCPQSPGSLVKRCLTVCHTETQDETWHIWQVPVSVIYLQTWHFLYSSPHYLKRTTFLTIIIFQFVSGHIKQKKKRKKSTFCTLS